VTFWPLAIYFLPTLIAMVRNHYSVGAIFLLNLIFGWTVLGWIIALIWSATGYVRRAHRRRPDRRMSRADGSPRQRSLATAYEPEGKMTNRTILRAVIIAGALASSFAASAQAEDTIYVSYVCVWSADQEYNIPIPVTHDGKSVRYVRFDVDTQKKTVTSFLGATLDTIDLNTPYVHPMNGTFIQLLASP